jgi:hypothetical protein
MLPGLAAAMLPKPTVRPTVQTSPKFPLHIWLGKPTLCGYTRPLSGESATNVRILLANSKEP